MKPPPRLAPEAEHLDHASWLEYCRAENDRRWRRDQRIATLTCVGILLLTVGAIVLIVSCVGHR